MRLPHVRPFPDSPLYFFTACTAARRPLPACREAHDVLQELWHASTERNGWFVGRYLLMPDHVHFFATPRRGATPRAEWHKLWKSVSSRRLARSLALIPPLWQADTFDHILRSAESYSAKWDYVRDNPVRAGLVLQPADWPWQGEIHSLRFQFFSTG